MDEHKDTAAVAAARNAVPGTVHLLDLKDMGQKTAAGKAYPSGDIVLVPQPTRNPDDPLNWQRWRKWLNVALLYFYVFCTGVGGTSVYSVLTPISKDTGITIAQLNTGTGFLFLLAGWANLVWQPCAMTFGRRPVFLLSILGCAGMSEWAAHISEYGEWAACRCLYGVMTAPVEVLPELCIAELFFAHERGAYMGAYMLVLATSNFIAPLIAGFMNETYGWQWVQHWCGILLLLNFVLAFFFYEDTMFERGNAEVDTCRSETSSTTLEDRKVLTLSMQQELDTDYAPKTYMERLKPWTVTSSDVSIKGFLLMAVRPVYIFFAFPVVMWCGGFYGWALSWYNVYNATVSSIYAEPPYNFKSSIVGLTYVAPTIGAVCGGLFAGPFSDWFTLRLARKNGGLREPEHRLWGLTWFALMMPAGLVLWGVGAAHQVHWVGLLFGGAFVASCNVIGGSYSLAYCVDVYKDMSAEALVSLILCRNTLSFAFNYAITPWIEHNGLQNTFVAVAMLALVTGLSFLLMIWKGKCLRRKSAQRYWRMVTTQVVHHE